MKVTLAYLACEVKESWVYCC